MKLLSFLNYKILLMYQLKIFKPDILIVDEVLAVGDHAFQEKCKKRMEEMLSSGTTLLFVSHSVKQVKELCEKVVWIDKGIAKAFGKTDDIFSLYESRLI